MLKLSRIWRKARELDVDVAVIAESGYWLIGCYAITAADTSVRRLASPHTSAESDVGSIEWVRGEGERKQMSLLLFILMQPSVFGTGRSNASLVVVC